MKKFLLFICFVFLCSIYSNAQINLLSDGKMLFGKTGSLTAVPGYFKTLIEGWGHHFYFDTNSGTRTGLKMDFGSAGARISGYGSAGYQVVFYDTETSQFNNIQVKSVLNYSDARAKENIVPIKNATDLVMNLNPVKYNFKNEDGLKVRKSSTGESLREVGFLAQEVEQVLPEAVHEDEEGRKLINYDAIIPLLAESFKEMNEEIAKLQNEIAELKSSSTTSLGKSDLLTAKDIKPILYQNTPNPFTDQTTIRYSIPTAYSVASICVFDLNGGLKLKKEIRSGVGEGTISINANELGAGLYLYSLVVNNAVSDTKRLLISK